MKILLFVLFIFSLGISVYAYPSPFKPGQDFGLVVSNSDNIHTAIKNSMTYTTENLTDKNFNNTVLTGEESGDYIYIYLYVDKLLVDKYINKKNPLHVIKFNMIHVAKNANGRACNVDENNFTFLDTIKKNNLIINLEAYTVFGTWISTWCTFSGGFMLFTYNYINNNRKNTVTSQGKIYYILLYNKLRIKTSTSNLNTSSALNGSSPYSASLTYNVTFAGFN